MQDQVPRIVRQGDRDLWVAGDQFIGAPGAYSMAGFDGVIPDMPKDFSEIPPAAYDADARLAFLDEEGIRAQVLYPNVGGFGNGFFLRLGDRDVVAASVRAYNDFLTDWCSADPDRLLPVIATPFWDLEFAVAEIERAAAMGHRAVNMCSQPQNFDEPPLGSAHWDPIWAAARDTGLSVSFHIGGGGLGNLMDDVGGIGLQANLGKESAMMILDNMRCLERPVLRRRVPPVPRGPLRLGGVRAWAGCRASWRPSTGSGATAASASSTPSTTCCPRSTSVVRCTPASGSSASAALGAIERYPGQHPLRDRLPPPDLPAPRAPHARPAAPGLRHRVPRRRCPTTCWPRSCTTTPPPSTGSREPAAEARAARRPAAGMSRQAAGGWLDGHRVVDLTTGIAGAYATKLLADAGAEVVLVEPPEGHPLRRWSASGSPTGDAGPLFRFLSAGKASVVGRRGRSRRPAGRQPTSSSRAATARSTSHGLRGGGHDGLLHHPVREHRAPGPVGPPPTSSCRPSPARIAFRGRRDQPPVAAGGRLAEWVTGAYAAVAALAAPPGEHVDVSELETMTLAGSLFLDLMWSLIGVEPVGPARTLEVPSIEPTLDGYVGFNTNTRQQFDDFLVLIERPDLLDDPDWISIAQRIARMEEWNAIVHPWTSRHTTADIVERAAAMRIPVAPVMSGRGVPDIDHFVERGVFVEDATGTFRQPRSPYALDGVRADTTRPAPDLGSTTHPFWGHPGVVEITAV